MNQKQYDICRNPLGGQTLLYKYIMEDNHGNSPLACATLLIVTNVKILITWCALLIMGFLRTVPFSNSITNSVYIVNVSAKRAMIS